MVVDGRHLSAGLSYLSARQDAIGHQRAALQDLLQRLTGAQQCSNQHVGDDAAGGVTIPQGLDVSINLDRHLPEPVVPNQLCALANRPAALVRTEWPCVGMCLNGVGGHTA